jgi:MoxR-like ATPase
LQQGTYEVAAASADRFTFLVPLGYLPPDEEQKLVNFDIKAVRLEQLLTAEQALEMRSLIRENVKLNGKVQKYIRRLVVATRPRKHGIVSPDTAKYLSDEDSPSELVQEYVQLGASPRATMSFGPTTRARALFARESDTVFPEDVKALAKNIFGHRIILKPTARRANITIDDVIDDVLRKVVVP